MAGLLQLLGAFITIDPQKVELDRFGQADVLYSIRSGTVFVVVQLYFESEPFAHILIRTQKAAE